MKHLLPLLNLPPEPMTLEPHALESVQAFVACIGHKPNGSLTPADRADLWARIGECEALDEARDLPVDIFPDVTQNR
jgi:hypothetical protein